MDGLETPGTSGITKKRPMLSAKLCARKKKKIYTFKNKTHSSQKSSEDEEENIDKRFRNLRG